MKIYRSGKILLSILLAAALVLFPAQTGCFEGVTPEVFAAEAGYFEGVTPEVFAAQTGIFDTLTGEAFGEKAAAFHAMTAEASPAEGTCVTEGTTMTLSGSMDEDVTAPEGIEKVVLKGFSLAEGRELLIDTEAILEIADGTTNSLDLLEIKGYVSVQGGGELYLTSGMAIMGVSILFNHSGKIVSDGPIACVGGDVTVNSGTILINNEEENSSGLVCLEGDITINGGDVQVNTEGSAVSAYGSVLLNGGSVSAESASGSAILAEGEDAVISVSDSIEGAENLEVDSGEGDFGSYTYFVTDREETAEVSLSGEPDEEAIQEANALFEEQSRLKAETRKTGEAGEETEESVLETEEETGEQAEDLSDGEETASDTAAAEETEAASEEIETGSSLSKGALVAIIAGVMVVLAGVLAFIFGRKKK